MPLLSTLANASARGYGAFGGVAASTNSYESIATVTVGAGGSSSIDFTSIPSTFKHLQIRGIARFSNASTTCDMRVQFNSDTGNNYNYRHYLGGDGSTAYAGGSGTLVSYGSIYRFTADSATSGQYGIMVFDLLDYQNTDKYKVSRVLAGYDRNGSGEIYLQSGLYLSTNAISSIKLYSDSGSNFLQYSQFALYGIKG